jgi:hypothetical protein
VFLDVNETPNFGIRAITCSWVSSVSPADNPNPATAMPANPSKSICKLMDFPHLLPA